MTNLLLYQHRIEHHLNYSVLGAMASDAYNSDLTTIASMPMPSYSFSTAAAQCFVATQNV